MLIVPSLNRRYWFGVIGTVSEPWLFFSVHRSIGLTPLNFKRANYNNETGISFNHNATMVSAETIDEATRSIIISRVKQLRDYLVRNSLRSYRFKNTDAESRWIKYFYIRD